MPTAAARKRRTDPLTEAVRALERAEPGRERAEALLDVMSEVSSSEPDLRRFRFSLLASLRSALAAGRVAEELAGSPRMLVEGIELPGFGPADIAREATVRGLARARVFDEEMFTASAVSTLLGSRSQNPRQYANKLRSRSEIVGVPHQNQYLYPAFQFDAEHHRIRPGAARVNTILRAAEDPWGVASWWISPNGSLHGRAPKELLTEPDGETILVESARDIAEGE